jgi:predicted nucleotidyltransferase
MHPLIENNREAIARLCRLHGVRSLEAFGSILRDDFDAARSDVDVLVEFDAQAADSFSNFLDLKQSLEAFIPMLCGFGGGAIDPQPPAALLHRAKQISDLCRSVIPVSTWKTSRIMPLRQYAFI